MPFLEEEQMSRKNTKSQKARQERVKSLLKEAHELMSTLADEEEAAYAELSSSDDPERKTKYWSSSYATTVTTHITHARSYLNTYNRATLGGFNEYKD